MNKIEFFESLQNTLSSFQKAISDRENQWVIKGFIDIHKNIYTISIDTKIISKVIEILLFPLLKDFGQKNNLQVKPCPQQNFYPDVTFLDRQNNSMFAVDIKTTYRVDEENVNGMTLGAFTGYFRNRSSTKNSVFPYSQYLEHFVLGVIYSQSSIIVDESQKYTINDLQKIPSVINEFQFFIQPKFKIASTHPGSGNTKNIGSITKISDLLYGKGPFAELGEDIFDDYWTHYLTVDMAKAIEIERPYTNLQQYYGYKSKGFDVLSKNKDKIFQLEKQVEQPKEKK